jgi:hypothetical protein
MSDEFYSWVQEATPGAPHAQDVWLYQSPAAWWRRLWWRVRMLLGRIVSRVKPRPNMVLYGCVPVRCSAPEGDDVVSVVSVSEFTCTRQL